MDARRWKNRIPREDDWTESDSAKLHNENHACDIMEGMLNAVGRCLYLWIAPTVSKTEQGKITIGWHKGKHELYIEVQCDEAQAIYIKVWGANIRTDMAAGILHRSHYLKLWKWLLDG